MKYEITKGSEKDFEGAPEWATLLTKTGGQMFFVEKHEARARVLNVDSGEEDKIDKSPMPGLFDNIKIIAERRPISDPVWDGEGLMPLVGMKCLAKQCSQINADEFLVVAIQDGAVFGFWTATGAATGLDVNRWIFLPIPSPEDVARNEAIEAMRDVVLASDQSLTCYESLYNAIAAGKIRGVKLE